MNTALTKLLELKHQGPNPAGQYICDESSVTDILESARVGDQPTYDGLRIMLAGLIDEARRAGTPVISMSSATLDDAIYAAA